MNERIAIPAAGAPLAVDELLSIDVDAEVRKLSARQFGQAHEVTIELARLLVRAGARQLDVVTSRRGVRLVAPGAVVSAAMLETLAQIFDGSVAPARRHELVVAWEAEHGTAWLAAMGADETVLASVSAVGTVELRRRRGESPSLRLDASRRGTPAVSIHSKRATERDVERHGVAQAARFARLPISVDGERVSRGAHAEDCFLAVELAAPGLAGVVGLPRDERHGRTIEVVDELVQRERLFHSPQGFVHVALAYTTQATPARDELLCSSIRAARDRLYERLATTAGAWPERELASAKDLLSIVALRTGEPRWLRRTALFVDAEGARATLDEVGASAKAGAVLYVDPSDAERAPANDLQRVFVLDELDRELVRRWLGLATTPAVPAEHGGVMAAAIRAVADDVRRLASVARGWWGGGHVAEAELDATERALAAALRLELTQRLAASAAGARQDVVRVGFVRRGRLPGRLERAHGHTTLWVPRRDPRVVRAAQQLARDPSLARWVLFACVGGRTQI